MGAVGLLYVGAVLVVNGFMLLGHVSPASAAPLNNAAESCCEGLMALAALARRAGSFDVHRMVAVADGLGYDGPRGPVSFSGNHLRQRVHLAVADGYDFDVLAAL